MSFKHLFYTLASSALLLSGCQQDDISEAQKRKPAQNLNLLDYSLSSVLECLPDEQAIIAAHRGVSRAWDIPENSLQGLKKLIQDGTLIAEIDVAGLKDGQHILFHDGVWDKKTTGQGPVASSTSADLEKLLLKTFAGTIAAERPPTLEDVLKLTKDKIFLEIDFKSSAKTDDVLRMIRANDMADQVVLIAYTNDRAQELHRLAPEMLISAPGADKGEGLTPEKTLLWMGRNIDQTLEPTHTLGYIGLLGRDDDPSSKVSHAKFLVSDYSNNHERIIGAKGTAVLEKCLTAN